MLINVCNLKKYFGSTKAVDGISFEFNSGHIFGFVGPNGAGKTTTMRIMATMDLPTSGDAFVDGVSVVYYPNEVRRRVGFMPDALPEHKDINVHEYLDFFARAYGLRGKARKSAVEYVEDFASLDNMKNKFLCDLSKGMKQRVSLARAIVHNPDLLILDEPAAGLDPRARIELRELLKILASQQKAIFISSHILTELAEICDGAVIIEQGHLLRAGMMNSLSVQEDSRYRQIAARIPGDSQHNLHREMLTIPGVLQADIIGNEVHAKFEGDEEMCAGLLVELTKRGLPVVEFRHEQLDLEDVFMSITNGAVQ